MKFALTVILLLLTIGMNNLTAAQTPEDLARAWDESHITDKPASDVRPDYLKVYLEKLRSSGVQVKEVGRSFGGREIYQADWGRGPFRVFMWSQMHGDEPTATSALVDMFAFLQTNRDKLDWVKKLYDSITLRAVPMLNPDGAEIYQRRNLQQIDINRDAQQLETPEGQLLKQLRDEFQPEIGFNLHNQKELTTAGKSFNQATISLLAVSGRKDDSTYPGYERNKRICSVMIAALNKFIPGHISEYDPTFNGQAFGDNFSIWGTPVILIETGGYHGKGEDFLIKLNFVAFLTALESISDGSWQKADPEVYESLPPNSSGRIYDLIIRNAEVRVPDNPDKLVTADIGLNSARRRAQFIAPFYVRTIGDLSEYKGLDEIDASQYYVVPKEGFLRPGTLGSFLFYKKTRTIDWRSENLEKEFPPDGILVYGKWLKPLE